ncbi:MAG: glycosyltransferase, partial [Acidobacteriaceae bacterium]|nr:glycosyltransferase [Acidobacteriaceae bacterium]
MVPCYNEAPRLRVERFRDFLEANLSKRILFVDDGSTDDTIRVLETVCRGYEDRAAILARSQNRGKAETVRAGVNHALENFTQEFIGYWDADLATPLEEIAAFLGVFEDNPRIEMVFGSRVKLLGRRVERKAIRHYLGRTFATVVSIM